METKIKCICGYEETPSKVHAHKTHCKQWSDWTDQIATDPETAKLISAIGAKMTSQRLGVNLSGLRDKMRKAGTYPEFPQSRIKHLRRTSPLLMSATPEQIIGSILWMGKELKRLQAENSQIKDEMRKFKAQVDSQRSRIVELQIGGSR